MKTGDYVEQVVGQESWPLFYPFRAWGARAGVGNLTVRLNPKHGKSDPVPNPLRVELRYYAATLWGAQFEHSPTGARPRFEFVNVGSYSVSTKAHQRDVYDAVDGAPRRYTPCLVIDPIDTGGKHWEPRYDWEPMQVAIDWCLERACVAGFGGAPSTPENPQGWRKERTRNKQRVLDPYNQCIDEGGRLLGATLNARAFWLLQTETRNPFG